MKISLEKLVQQWQELLTDGDLDIVADLTGLAFGGECHPIDNPNNDWEEWYFEFIPNADYAGAFDEQ